jgi:hypothetical protein
MVEMWGILQVELLVVSMAVGLVETTVASSDLRLVER